MQCIIAEVSEPSSTHNVWRVGVAHSFLEFIDLYSTSLDFSSVNVEKFYRIDLNNSLHYCREYKHTSTTNNFTVLYKAQSSKEEFVIIDFLWRLRIPSVLNEWFLQWYNTWIQMYTMLEDTCYSQIIPVIICWSLIPLIFGAKRALFGMMWCLVPAPWYACIWYPQAMATCLYTIR